MFFTSKIFYPDHNSWILYYIILPTIDRFERPGRQSNHRPGAYVYWIFSRWIFKITLNARIRYHLICLCIKVVGTYKIFIAMNSSDKFIFLIKLERNGSSI